VIPTDKYDMRRAESYVNYNFYVGFNCKKIEQQLEENIFLISINCVPKLVWDFPRLCGLDTLIKFIYLSIYLTAGRNKKRNQGTERKPNWKRLVTVLENKAKQTWLVKYDAFTTAILLHFLHPI